MGNRLQLLRVATTSSAVTQVPAIFMPQVCDSEIERRRECAREWRGARGKRGEARKQVGVIKR